MELITLENLIPDLSSSINRINFCISVQNFYLKHSNRFGLVKKEEVDSIVLPLLQIDHLLGQEKKIIYSISSHPKIKNSLIEIIDKIWEKNQKDLIPALLKIKI